MKIAVLFSNGTEELEALTPVDVLKRAGVTVDIISVCDSVLVGSHDIKVQSDYLLKDVDLNSYDGIVIPGGMPGAEIISNNQIVISALENFFAKNKLVAAICASPALVLARNGFIDGRKATCYPSTDFIKLMAVTDYREENVVVDGNLITANGPKSAFAFSLAICDYLGFLPKF